MDNKKDNTQYNVGDIVRIKGDLKAGVAYRSNNAGRSSYFVKGMAKYRDRCTRITKVISSGGYELGIDDGRYIFSDEMLKPIEVIVNSEDMNYNENSLSKINRQSKGGLVEAVRKESKKTKEYKFKYDTDKVIHESLRRHYEKAVNDGLKSGMFRSDPKDFQELVDNYNKYSNSN